MLCEYSNVHLTIGSSFTDNKILLLYIVAFSRVNARVEVRRR